VTTGNHIWPPSSLLRHRTSFAQAILLPNLSRLKLRLRLKLNLKSVLILPLLARSLLAVLVLPLLAINMAQAKADHHLETDMALPEHQLPHILDWDPELLRQIPSPRFRATLKTSVPRAQTLQLLVYLSGQLPQVALCRQLHLEKKLLMSCEERTGDRQLSVYRPTQATAYSSQPAFLLFREA
jgi:hypothetical protein